MEIRIGDRYAITQAPSSLPFAKALIERLDDKIPLTPDKTEKAEGAESGLMIGTLIDKKQLPTTRPHGKRKSLDVQQRHRHRKGEAEVLGKGVAPVPQL